MASWKITCIKIKGEREVGSLDSSVLKKSTTKRSRDQIQHLETFFQTNEFINGERRLELAQLTNLSADQVSIWFRNQRQKKKQEKDGADQQVFKNHRNEVSLKKFLSVIWSNMLKSENNILFRKYLPLTFQLIYTIWLELSF